MIDRISVIIPTYNPTPSRMAKTLSGLHAQSLSTNQWELIIIDNNSHPPVKVDLNWHPHHKIIREEKPGLTHARLKGFDAATGTLIVMVDDDNILDNDYLKNILSIFESNNKLGAIGGKSLPLFETLPPNWLNEFYSNLALRDLGNVVLISGWQNKYPEAAPIGAGMAIRRQALETYINKITNGTRVITDRTGNSLSSGGDNDMVIEITRAGWQVGYFPELKLSHIIPPGRMQPKYLAKLLNNTNRSWVQLLESHGISPWDKIAKWSVPLRKLKAWFTYRGWQNKVNYIKWRGACGLFDGLADK
jgi:glycosyltransferase involved in cell wall biosynthesis